MHYMFFGGRWTLENTLSTCYLEDSFLKQVSIYDIILHNKIAISLYFYNITALRNERNYS